MSLHRTFWGFLLLLGLLAACSSPTAEIQSGELSLYTFTAYVPDELISQFESQTGVSVTVATYSTNEEMLAGLAANPSGYDLIIPSDYAVEILIKQNALLPLDLGKISNYNNIEQSFLSPYFDPGGATAGRRPAARNEKYSLPYQWGTTGIAYDTTKVSEPISRWEDLWRPDLAGHIVLIDDAREVMGLTLQTLGYSKNDTNPARLAEARDKLKLLMPGVVALDADAPESYLISGEAWVAVIYNGNAALAIEANPNISYVFPEEGAGIWFDNLAIPAQAPHPDAAEAFINSVLLPENSVLITKAFSYSNPNTAALAYLEKNEPTLYQTYISSSTTNPSPLVLAGAQLVKNVGTTVSNLYEQYWLEAKTR